MNRIIYTIEFSLCLETNIHISLGLWCNNIRAFTTFDDAYINRGADSIVTELMKAYDPLGKFIDSSGTSAIPIDVRVIAATNQNLFNLVKAKKFRMDLYFRLNVFDLRLPPLRERAGDIPILVKRFFEDHGIKTDMPHETMRYLQAYPWPGNIRELKNCVEYMWYLGEGYDAENFPAHIHQYFEMERDQKEEHIHQNENEIPLSASLDSLDYIILKAISNPNGTSRRKILTILDTENHTIPESTLRMRLTKLATLGLITVERGCRGTHLTSRGRIRLDELH